MLYNNYKQALNIIETDSIALSDGLQSLRVTIQGLIAWEAEEAVYFLTLGEEPEWDAHTVAYVELLQELRSLEYVFSIFKIPIIDGSF